MSKKIPLTQGKFAIVDDEDYEWLSQWKWAYHPTGTGYAIRFIQVAGKQKGVLMHRMILDVPHDMETDHINHNGLDNRRTNLRICSHAENMANKRKYKNNTSGYIGVYWDKERGQWRAQIQGHGIHLGRFNDVKEAARAYDRAASELHGEFALLNLPDRLED